MTSIVLCACAFSCWGSNVFNSKTCKYIPDFSLYRCYPESPWRYCLKAVHLTNYKLLSLHNHPSLNYFFQNIFTLASVRTLSYSIWSVYHSLEASPVKTHGYSILYIPLRKIHNFKWDCQQFRSPLLRHFWPTTCCCSDASLWLFSLTLLHLQYSADLDQTAWHF